MQANEVFWKKRWMEIAFLGVIFLLALAIRVRWAWPALTGQQGFIMWDDEEYHQLAVSILHDGQFFYKGYEGGFHNGLQAFRMPAFPLMLVPIYLIFGAEPRYGSYLIVLLGALLCVGVYFLAKRVFGPRVAVVAALVCMIDISQILFTRLLSTEIPTSFFLVMSMIVLERLRQRQSAWLALAAGALLGVNTMTRVNFGVLVVIAALWLLWYSRPIGKVALRNAAILCAVVGAMWVPWVVRNYMIFHTFVPFTTQSGEGYNIIYSDSATRLEDWPDYGYWLWARYTPPASLDRLSELDRDGLQKSLAFEWIRTHPLQAVVVDLLQPVHFWRAILPDIFGLGEYMMLALAFVGFLRARLLQHPSVTLWVGCTLALMFQGLISWGVGRFHIPLQPLLVIFVAYAIVSSLVRIRQAPRRTTQAVPGAKVEGHV